MSNLVVPAAAEGMPSIPQLPAAGDVLRMTAAIEAHREAYKTWRGAWARWEASSDKDGPFLEQLALRASDREDYFRRVLLSAGPMTLADAAERAWYLLNLAARDGEQLEPAEIAALHLSFFQSGTF